MIAEATATKVCTLRLSLLERWLSISRDYFRVVLAAIKSKSKIDRVFLRAVVEDAKTQVKPLCDNSRFTG
jgi:hypothetical protein